MTLSRWLFATFLLATPGSLLADDAKTPLDRARLAEVRGGELFTALSIPVADIPPAARAAFAAAGTAPCPGATAQAVALPAAADGSRMVYLLSRTGEGDAPFTGGHFRVELAADGSPGTVARLGEGCDRLAWKAGEDDNMRVAYLVHSGTDTPDEIDVLLSREVPFALGVVTGDVVWPVIGGTIADPVEADPGMGQDN